MKNPSFSTRDLRQIHEMGLTEGQVRKQIARVQKGTPYLDLVRPCTIGDGIKQLTPDSLNGLIQTFKQESAKLGLTKFVPASGAATRMFNTLIRAENSNLRLSRADVKSLPLENKKDNHELLAFMDNIRKFAFYDDLASAMAGNGLDAEALIRKGEFKECLSFLLTDTGLNYANLPKGLIRFHAYPEGTRTAFEEHLVEAAGYAPTDKNRCDLHFTVSENHVDSFRSLFESVKDTYESRLKVCFNVTFSIQQPHTNTIALDMSNQPFRRANGSLLFRPGGHGALIDNLNHIEADIIFIKNIDNVAHDRFTPVMFDWKQALTGYLITLQDKAFSLLKQLHKAPGSLSVINKAAGFLQDEFCRGLPDGFDRASSDEKLKHLIKNLNRPIRVCGMVKNVGEPGGGPFWVRHKTGDISIQIVENAQINTGSKQQKATLNALTYFNPVDIVCGVKDRHGKKFDLAQYVDHDAVFITTKYENGRPLKALEHPGLWNGAMAYWNTVFVEVPRITFNPVKKVVDLLDEAHQP